MKLVTAVYVHGQDIRWVCWTKACA